MEWLNDPNQVTPDGACGVRICNSKEYCDGYLCVVLYCTKND